MPDPTHNPFLDPPPVDPVNAAIDWSVNHPIEAALAPRPNAFHGQGPLMSLADHVALAKAPKLPGTMVTVEAYPAIVPFDPADHMYVQFDDGQHSYIYRGGPQSDGRVGAAVMPARLSPDYGKGRTPMYETFLPGISAEQAIGPAQADAARVNREANPYGIVTSNSNSVVGDFTARQYGHRVGGGPIESLLPGAWTPGYQYDLPEHPSVTDLGPAIEALY